VTSWPEVTEILAGEDDPPFLPVTEAFSLVIEGQCPHGHGPLVVRPLRPHASGTRAEAAGWCEPCRLGYSATTHRHDEDCAGPNLDEADLLCPFDTGERTVTYHHAIAFG
jgi:hypothetical protein